MQQYIIVHLVPHHSTNPILQLVMLLSLFCLPGCFRLRNFCPIIVTISVSLIPLYLIIVQVLKGNSGRGFLRWVLSWWPIRGVPETYVFSFPHPMNHLNSVHFRDRSRVIRPKSFDWRHWSMSGGRGVCRWLVSCIKTLVLESYHQVLFFAHL